VSAKSSYEEIHIVTRAGREDLYPMSTSVYPIALSSRKSMGNSGISPPKNSIIKNLKSRFKTVECISPLKGGMRYAKKRKFITYKASPELVEKWDIPKNSVVCSVRGRNFGTHKNWSGHNWEKLCCYIIDNNFVPIITGIKELVEFNLPEGCVDLRDKTTMGDLAAIMQQSCFVIGQSSGPMHYASLCQVPHAVWGHPRLLGRYKDTWNPHKTIVEYHSCQTQFEISTDEAKDLFDNMRNKLKI
jgi:ADP-heptose:LPS heptosyltransferase